MKSNKKISFHFSVFICSLLDQIPQTFANTQETETILAPVIQSGIQALKVGHFLFEFRYVYNEYHREQIVQEKFLFFKQHYR